MASRSHSLWFNTYGLGPVFNSCGRSYPTTFLGTFGWADALPSVIFPLLSLIGVFWAPPLSGGRAWMPKLSKKRWRNKMIYTSKVGSNADVRWSKQTPGAGHVGERRLRTAQTATLVAGIHGSHKLTAAVLLSTNQHWRLHRIWGSVQESSLKDLCLSQRERQQGFVLGWQALCNLTGRVEKSERTFLCT